MGPTTSSLPGRQMIPGRTYLGRKKHEKSITLAGFKKNHTIVEGYFRINTKPLTIKKQQNDYGKLEKIQNHPNSWLNPGHTPESAASHKTMTRPRAALLASQPSHSFARGDDAWGEGARCSVDEEVTESRKAGLWGVSVWSYVSKKNRTGWKACFMGRENHI